MYSCVITHKYKWNAQNGHSIHSTYLFQYRTVARMLGILLFFVVCTIFDSIVYEPDGCIAIYSEPIEYDMWKIQLIHIRYISMFFHHEFVLHSGCIHGNHHRRIIDMTFILYSIHYKYDMILDSY